MMRDDSLAATVAKARDALRAGNAWLCFDVAQRALDRGLRASELEYLAILALAHCGSTRQALERYQRSVRDIDEADQDWFALEGRLFKDLAQQDTTAARFLYERAAQAYLQAFHRTGGYFSAVNAASMLTLSGNDAQARKLAADVVVLVGPVDAGDELERYHRLVSHAEAALLLGELDRAREALRAADPLVRDHRSTRARTVRQLQLLCRHRRVDKSIPLLLTVPPQLFVYREADIAPQAPPDDAPAIPAPPIAAGAAAFAGLADPVDVCVVERLLAAGAHVTVAIADGRERLMQQWQRDHGAAWSLRLARTLERVGATIAVPGFTTDERRWLRRHLAGQSLGLSRHAPEPIRSQWSALIVEPAAQAPGFALQALDGSRLREIERSLADTGCPLSEAPRAAGLRERRICALLVLRCDAATDDAALLALRRQVLRPLGQDLAAHAPKLVWRGSFGAVALIAIADAAAAAELAARCLAHGTHSAGDAEPLATPQLLLHAGPVFVGDDPLDGGATVFGSELEFAIALSARVPAASVLATQSFVAQYHLERAEGCSFEYVGESARTRSRAAPRLFSLRPA